MKKKKTLHHRYDHPQRFSFREDEAIHPWLPMLLDAYCLIDRGISEGIKAEVKKGRRLACSKGCSHCCKTHQTIPVYPLELVGLSWFVIEKVKGSERETIKTYLKNYRENDPCPFLINGACSVHPMRPAACRQFNVFDTPCAEGEDPYYTRRESVLSPLKKYIDRAFFIMLPFYGVENESERTGLIETGKVHQLVKLMQTCNWKSLAEKMDEYDKRITK
jgi:Fe-S-cluster containining protein